MYGPGSHHRNERRSFATPGSGSRLSHSQFVLFVFFSKLRGACAGHEQQHRADEQKWYPRKARNESQKQHEYACYAHGFGGSEKLFRQFLSQRGIRLFTRHAGYQNPRGGGQHERWDLRHQPIANRQQSIAF